MADETPPVTPSPAAPDHAAIEKARLEERAKLRSELDALTLRAQQTDAALAKATADLTKATEALTRLTTDYTTLKDSVKAGASNEPTVDVEALLTKAAQATAASFVPQITKLEADLAAERNTRQRVELAQLKDRLVTAAATEHGVSADLLGALVTGNNQDELAASLASRIELVKKAVPSGVTTNDHAMSGGVAATGGTPLPVSARQSGAAVSEKSVREMTDEEWRNQGPALKRAAVSRYPGASPVSR